MQNFPAERPHERAGPAGRKRDAPEDICRTAKADGTAAGYAGGLGVTKRRSPLSFWKAGNIFLFVIIYRSFLSSSRTEYGIARLPQPVPMEMCVLRVPW